MLKWRLGQENVDLTSKALFVDPWSWAFKSVVALNFYKDYCKVEISSWGLGQSNCQGDHVKETCSSWLVGIGSQSWSFSDLVN